MKYLQQISVLAMLFASVAHSNNFCGKASRGLIPSDDSSTKFAMFNKICGSLKHDEVLTPCGGKNTEMIQRYCCISCVGTSVKVKRGCATKFQNRLNKAIEERWLGLTKTHEKNCMDMVKEHGQKNLKRGSQNAANAAS